MKNLSILLAAGALAAPTFAQNALNESFDYSTTAMFPPTGWTNVINPGSASLGWEEITIQTTSNFWAFMLADAAGHDDYNSGQFNDNSLHTPTMDLSAYGSALLTFDEELKYASWMLHNGNTTAAGVSTIEVSTDGGATWTTEWTESATADGLYTGLTVDLAAYGGQAAVDMQFHYVGTYAHGWALDNVVVDNGGAPVGPGLALGGTCPGPQTADGSGMTPGGPVAFYYALSAGSVTLPSGACAGLTLPVSSPTQLGGFVIADGAGNASISGNTNPNRCGNLMLGAVDVATCTGSNVVML